MTTRTRLKYKWGEIIAALTGSILMAIMVLWILDLYIRTYG